MKKVSDFTSKIYSILEFHQKRPSVDGIKSTLNVREHAGTRGLARLSKRGWSASAAAIILICTKSENTTRISFLRRPDLTRDNREGNVLAEIFL